MGIKINVSEHSQRQKIRDPTLYQVSLGVRLLIWKSVSFQKATLLFTQTYLFIEPFWQHQGFKKAHRQLRRHLGLSLVKIQKIIRSSIHVESKIHCWCVSFYYNTFFSPAGIKQCKSISLSHFDDVKNMFFTAIVKLC